MINILQNKKKYPELINLNTNISTSLINVTKIMYKILSKNSKNKFKISIMNIEKKINEISYKEIVNYKSKFLNKKKFIKIDKGIQKLVNFLS